MHFLQFDPKKMQWSNNNELKFCINYRLYLQMVGQKSLRCLLWKVASIWDKLFEMEQFKSFQVLPYTQYTYTKNFGLTLNKIVQENKSNGCFHARN